MGNIVTFLNENQKVKRKKLASIIAQIFVEGEVSDKRFLDLIKNVPQQKIEDFLLELEEKAEMFLLEENVAEKIQCKITD